MSLSDTADDLRLSRIVVESGRLSDFAIQDLQNRLVLDPFDLISRVRLLAHYNRIFRSPNPGLPSTSRMHVEHILWFVDNIPDSKFCGEADCYLFPSDQDYQTLKNSWLRQISSSKALMRRVNAFLLFINSSEPGLMAMLRNLFKDCPDNVWVKALKSHLEPSLNWQAEFIALLGQTFDSSPEVTPKYDSVEDDRQLNRLAAKASGSASKSEFRRALAKLQEHPVDMTARAIVLGYTFSSHLSNTVLGFEPELATLRFEQMCWLVRHAPGSEFASHALAMDPLNDLPVFNEHLAFQWSTILKDASVDQQILKNAAIFCSKLTCSPSAKLIYEQLKKTKDGQKIFAKVSSRL